MSLSLPLPKAVLYYHTRSVWSSAVLICLEEKGYGKDELEWRLVSIDKGDNFAPAFLRISPKGTVPALVVPTRQTLAPNVAHKYKALTTTKTILEFLDESRLVSSKTHTTSFAPAPALRPATVSHGDISNRVIETLHTTLLDFLNLAALNQEELISKATGQEGDFVKLKRSVLEEYLNTPDAPQAAKSFWEARFYENEFIWKVYSLAEVPTSNLEPQQATEREAFFKQSRSAWKGIKHALQFLEKHMIGPYTLGDQLSLVDLHLVAWFSRVLHLAKAPHPASSKTFDTNYTGFENLQEVICQITGDTNFIVEQKLKEFCVAMMNRKSWSQVYKDGLH